MNDFKHVTSSSSSFPNDKVEISLLLTYVSVIIGGEKKLC
jgi:hypothetical protein